MGRRLLEGDLLCQASLLLILSLNKRSEFILALLEEALPASCARRVGLVAKDAAITKLARLEVELVLLSELRQLWLFDF